MPYILWTKKKGVGRIATDKLLEDTLPSLSKKHYIAKPIGLEIGSWQTSPKEIKEFNKIEGKNYYEAHLGVVVSPYGVFRLQIKQILSNNNLIVTNLNDKGKVKVPKVEDVIENELVYPGVRSCDIKKWTASSRIYILITHPASQIPYSEQEMKKNWPKTYGYLTKFRDILLQMALYKHFHKPSGNPFYGQRDIADFTFSNFKVIWRRQSSELVAAVISQNKTPFGYKNIISLDPTALIAANNESEAHYLCAIINSKPISEFIKSFSAAGRGFGTPSVMENVGIPKFDPKNNLHQSLAEISKKCHQLKTEDKDYEVTKLEKENNQLVKKLFGV